jgi:MYXO-CTERM domain-containing protein
MRTKLSIACALAAALGGGRLAHAECTSPPVCSGGPVRIMFVVDAASDLLNGPSGPAAMGDSQWDRMRDVLAVDGGPNDDSIFSAVVDMPSDIVISQIAHVGLIAYGSADQEVRVLDYGPCSRDNLEWALDPRSSCATPGCTDPWGGPPITWTSVDGSEVDPPGFARETISTMPLCDGALECTGSGRAVHAGIELATANRADYIDATNAPTGDETIWVNILLVAGNYAASGTDMQVQAALEDAFAEGVTTHVVLFGTAAQSPSAEVQMQIENMAAWGSNGMLTPRVATNDDELHDAIQQIVASLPLPCCFTIDCSGAGGADEGGIGNDGGGSDDGADGNEWGSLDGDGDGSASADGTGDGDASADADADGSATASDSDTDDAGFDDDGGCRCTSGPSRAAWGLALVGLALVRRRRTT